jgi:hypothetical protein
LNFDKTLIETDAWQRTRTEHVACDEWLNSKQLYPHTIWNHLFDLVHQQPMLQFDTEVQ